MGSIPGLAGRQLKLVIFCYAKNTLSQAISSIEDYFGAKYVIFRISNDTRSERILFDMQIE